jgi:hypothetical protein
LFATLRVALRLTFAEGANFTTIEQLPPGARLAPQLLELML